MASLRYVSSLQLSRQAFDGLIDEMSQTLEGKAAETMIIGHIEKPDGETTPTCHLLDGPDETRARTIAVLYWDKEAMTWRKAEPHPLIDYIYR